MRILTRYFLSEYFKIFFICLLSFMTVYLLIDFLGKIDNFIEAGVGKGVMFSFFVFKIPYIIVQMTPVASLISVIILFCLLKGHNEIMALRASGFSVFALSRPIIAAAFGIALGLFLFSEILVPYTSSKSNEIWAVEVEKRDPSRFYGSNQIWYRGDEVIYWIQHFNFKENRLESPSFYFFNHHFELTKRIEAREGAWENGKWKVREAIVQVREADGSYSLKNFSELTLDLPETPDTFKRSERKPEEMSFWQLQAYAQKVRQEGYDNTRYLVDMHVKVALPFVSLVLVFTGIPIAIGLKKGGAPVAVSAGMGVCFAYLLVLGFSRSLGLSGTLPPFLSAWIATFIFLLLGIYLMMHIEK